MLQEGGGFGVHDIYGFNEVAVPALPSGDRLVLTEMKQEVFETSTAADEDAWLSMDGDWTAEDAITWRRIQAYVSAHDEGAAQDPDPASLVGAEVWPAAAALCGWLADRVDAIHGTSVLELGSGTGVCGIYAASLGAARVLLTDGGSSLLNELIEANLAANHCLYAGAQVEFARLEWGGDVVRERFDYVLASDVTYGHDSHRALAATIGALLRSETPPRVILAHEHRSREGLLGVNLTRWDEGDEHLDEFRAAADDEGLSIAALWSQRPAAAQRGHFRYWSADLSIIEVVLAHDHH